MIPYYDELNDDRKASLLKQIEGIDFSLLDLIKENTIKKVEDLHTTKNLGQSICIRSF